MNAQAEAERRERVARRWLLASLVALSCVPLLGPLGSAVWLLTGPHQEEVVPATYLVLVVVLAVVGSTALLVAMGVGPSLLRHEVVAVPRLVVLVVTLSVLLTALMLWCMPPGDPDTRFGFVALLIGSVASSLGVAVAIWRWRAAVAALSLAVPPGA